ncbi:MAG: hypothetical protein ACPF9W_06270, partial [Nocardioides sp.]
MSGLRDELHRLDEGVHVPPTQAAEGAWSTARRRVRRRRAAAVGGACALARRGASPGQGTGTQGTVTSPQVTDSRGEACNRKA